MIGVIDYGGGNMQSVANALAHLGEASVTCRVGRDLESVDRIVLPGVGHFASASRNLENTGLLAGLQTRAREGVPIFGICLGLQLLFDGSDEAPNDGGLGLLQGRVERLVAERVPHMGWNRVTFERVCPFARRGDNAHYYFAHGFAAAPAIADDVIATVEVDGRCIPAVVGRGNVWGVQFHPEKSAARGLELLRRFAQC